MIYITTYPLTQRINPMRKLLLTTASVAAALCLAGCSKKQAPESVSEIIDTLPVITYDTLTDKRYEQEIPDGNTLSVTFDTLLDKKDESTHWDENGVPEEENTLDGTPILKDTLIPISKDIAILYREYNETLELWYKPHIVNLDKRDTVKISDDSDYECGSMFLSFDVSPNVKYVVLEYIDRGFLSTGRLHNHNYDIIVDIKDACTIMRLDGTDRDGEWDDNDNWLSRDKIIFNSKKYEIMNKR
jgi:hypothetical protein